MANFRLKKKSEREKKYSEIIMKKGNPTFLPLSISSSFFVFSMGFFFQFLCTTVSSCFFKKIPVVPRFFQFILQIYLQEFCTNCLGIVSVYYSSEMSILLLKFDEASLSVFDKPSVAEAVLKHCCN